LSDRQITALARRLGRACAKRGVTLVTAESCTGGGVAEAITRIPGSSAWFDRGFVTYSYESKPELLGVRQGTLERHGAVSEETAREMARGALRRSGAGVSVAITGIAGPGGGTKAKPVGLVCFAWAVRGGPVETWSTRFPGGRGAVRASSITVAIQGLIEILR
jgi:nicotinamide-nucleotide amidase